MLSELSEREEIYSLLPICASLPQKFDGFLLISTTCLSVIAKQMWTFSASGFLGHVTTSPGKIIMTHASK